MVISSDLLRGYTDAIILRCLTKGDGYGYQISKEVSAASDGKLELKEAEAARWLSVEELDEVKWLPADLQILEKIRNLGD